MKSLLYAALITLGAPNITPTKLPNDFTFIEVPPLSYTGKTNITVQGAFIGRQSRYCTIELFNMFYPSGKELYRVDSTGSYDFVYEYPNSYTTSDMYLRFKDSRVDKFIDIYPKFVEAPIINVTDDIKVVSFLNIATYSNVFGLEENFENYDFRGFDSIYVPDYYHKLDLSSFQLKVGNKTRDTFKYKSAVFYIYDPDDLFEEFAQYRTGDYIQLPLDFQLESNKYYSLRLKNPLYVNKLNLKMSFTKKDEYVETRHIYFPINQMQNVETYRFALTISDLGYNMAYISYSFTVRAFKNIVGDCSNSKYCIGISNQSRGNS